MKTIIKTIIKTVMQHTLLCGLALSSTQVLAMQNTSAKPAKTPSAVMIKDHQPSANVPAESSLANNTQKKIQQSGQHAENQQHLAALPYHYQGKTGAEYLREAESAKETTIFEEKPEQTEKFPYQQTSGLTFSSECRQTKEPFSSAEMDNNKSGIYHGKSADQLIIRHSIEQAATNCNLYSERNSASSVFIGVQW